MDNPYDCEDDNKVDRFVLALLALIASILLVACVVEGVMWREAEDVLGNIEVNSPGQPLDRVRMKAPSWSSADYMYMMVYRTNGARWLRIQMDGKWETWEICDGQGYVEQ